MDDLDGICTPLSDSSVTTGKLEFQSLQPTDIVGREFSVEPLSSQSTASQDVFISSNKVSVGSKPVKGMTQLIPAGKIESANRIVPRFLMIEPEDVRVHRSPYFFLSSQAYGFCKKLDWSHLQLAPDGSVEAIIETATSAEMAELDSSIPQEVTEAITEKILIIDETPPSDPPSLSISGSKRVFISSSKLTPQTFFRVQESVGVGILIALDTLEHLGWISSQEKRNSNFIMLGTLTYLNPTIPTHLVLISAPFTTGREFTSTLIASTGVELLKRDSLGNKIAGTLGGMGATSAIVRATGGISVWHSAASSFQNQIGGALYSIESAVMNTARPIAQNLFTTARNYWNQGSLLLSSTTLWARSVWGITRPILAQATRTAVQQTTPELVESLGIALLDGPEPGPADVVGAINAAIALGTGFLILGAGIQIAYQNIPTYPDSQTESQSGQN